jgi:hypothetical protein
MIKLNPAQPGIFSRSISEAVQLRLTFQEAAIQGSIKALACLIP